MLPWAPYLGPFKYVNTLKPTIEDPLGVASLGPFKYVNTLKHHIGDRHRVYLFRTVQVCQYSQTAALRVK